MRVVIIEDELHTAEDLSATIKELRPSFEVVKFLHSVKEAKMFLNSNSDFNLLFSDINLGDGLSFEIFKELNIKTPVIFCTAYDNYAIEAFKANGIDYVLKPFNKKGIAEAIEKFERLGVAKQMSPAISELMDVFRNNLNQKKSKTYLIHVKDKIIPIKAEEVAVFYIKNEQTTLLDFKGKSYIINDSLDDIELENPGFLFRANRQFIINRAAIKDVSQYFSRKLLVNLTVPFTEQIIISKEKSSVFLKWLEDS